MTKKARVRDYDQFIVRLPPGMRDRIKVKAERAGMSMNEAIVWVLEKEFPAPVTLEERLQDLANLVSMLADSKDTYAGVENLISEIEATVDSVASRGGLPADTNFRKMVRERLDYWRELEMDNWRERTESPFRDVESPPSSGNADPFDDLPE